MTLTSNASRYVDGTYAQQHPTWHAEDAQYKARDIQPAIQSIIRQYDTNQTQLRICDVGGGSGHVLRHVVDSIKTLNKNLTILPTLFEIATAPVEAASRDHPDFEIKRRLFANDDGPFDIVMLVDVLEHVENPWDLLRAVRTASRHLVVRQPLLCNFPRFRHNNYADQRHQWGHISYFNYHSFVDMAHATGWEILKADLVAPWELHQANNKGSFLKRLCVKTNREFASFFIDGFYLNASLTARKD